MGKLKPSKIQKWELLFTTKIQYLRLCKSRSCLSASHLKHSHELIMSRNLDIWDPAEPFPSNQVHLKICQIELFLPVFAGRTLQFWCVAFWCWFWQCQMHTVELDLSKHHWLKDENAGYQFRYHCLQLLLITKKLPALGPVWTSKLCLTLDVSRHNWYTA